LKRILALDVGERRIGIAVSDPLKIIASPLTIIDRKITPDYTKEIKQLVLKNNIEKLVIGIPKTLKNTESIQTKIVIEFIQELQKNVDIPIETVDERLSSVSAQKSLVEQGIKTGHNKGKIDETAAAIFLQEYLDSH